MSNKRGKEGGLPQAIPCASLHETIQIGLNMFGLWVVNTNKLLPDLHPAFPRGMKVACKFYRHPPPDGNLGRQGHPCHHGFVPPWLNFYEFNGTVCNSSDVCRLGERRQCVFPPRVPTYPKCTIADVLVPARTLIAVKLLTPTRYYHHWQNTII